MPCARCGRTKPADSVAAGREPWPAYAERTGSITVTSDGAGHAIGRTFTMPWNRSGLRTRKASGNAVCSHMMRAIGPVHMPVGGAPLKGQARLFRPIEPNLDLPGRRTVSLRLRQGAQSARHVGADAGARGIGATAQQTGVEFQPGAIRAWHPRGSAARFRPDPAPHFPC